MILNNNNKQVIVQIGREFYNLNHIPELSVDNKNKPNIKKFKKILNDYDVRLLREVEE